MRTTEEAAAALDVSPARVRALIRAGTLTATKFGDVWAVDEASLRALSARQRTPGPRSFAPRIAWAAAVVADRDRPTWLSSSELSRLRARISQHATADVWQTRMARRAAQSVTGWIHPDRIARLEADPRIMDTPRATTSRAELVGVPRFFWVHANELSNVLEDHAVLISSNPNTTFRLAPQDVPTRCLRHVPTLIALADMFDEADPRTRELGRHLLDNLMAKHHD